MVIITPTINAPMYIEVLDNFLIPLIENWSGDSYTQDIYQILFYTHSDFREIQISNKQKSTYLLGAVFHCNFFSIYDVSISITLFPPHCTKEKQKKKEKRKKNWLTLGEESKSYFQLLMI